MLIDQIEDKRSKNTYCASPGTLVFRHFSIVTSVPPILIAQKKLSLIDFCGVPTNGITVYSDRQPLINLAICRGVEMPNVPTNNKFYEHL